MKTAELPQPDPDAAASSAVLAKRIHAEIEASGGWISFARFMELALYAPIQGYYSGGARKFGNVLDPNSEVAYILRTKRVFIQFKEEMGTSPRFFYYFDV